MFSNYIGILNLNEDESNLRSLSLNRPLASIPIYGRYRIIDFILSNLVNAGVKSVGIFAQTYSRSLMDHLGIGKPWDLNRRKDGLFIFNYSLNNSIINDVIQFKENIEYFYKNKGDYVILASSRMLCNIDLEKAALYHEKSKNDVTVIYKNVKGDDETFLNCDVLNIDENNRVLSVGKIIGLNCNVNISMDILIMKKDFLIECIYKSIENGNYSSLKNYIYNNCNKINIGVYEFKGYLSCINSIRSYYKTSMDILDTDIREELFFKNGKIYTKSNNSPPTKYCKESEVKNSIISNGCIIKGSIKNSILSRSVKIDYDTIIEDSIIFGNCVIGKGAKLKNVILDKNVVVEEGKNLIGDKKFPVVIEKGEVVKNLYKKAEGSYKA
ncbi:glucose-1-phosphate adenylyltransferase subunit GlgD [Aceticella autotrophica]|uniref:Glucose-1-phosphate adenylyltransferase subunit GlgD n=1 Tax=Aceticella autotrophica TaxID=2755338 RepID=A0A975AWE6_9THEO|nr:glucose-1-phosphate adenylyltransferase subunit GlgD [Aceticella autotrophica]QSZ27709.1 glucose-1-phosphate adenylyltransferase subunit GlgD [Aceticella autotrophica]